MKKIIKKIRSRLWFSLVKSTMKKPWYYYLYTSYWHLLLSKKNNMTNTVTQYFSTYPNSGAGIGHQMANWISGYWWASQCKLNYAYIPFPNQNWDNFLGFGENEVKVEDLLKQGFNTVLLPLFHEDDKNGFLQIKKIIDSYANKKVIFIAEQDQGFKNHYEIMDVLKQKFHNAPARKNDILTYSDAFYNIAIHVRRGDIVANKNNKISNLSMRWQNNSYFATVLQEVIETIKPGKPIKIYLFSQGEREDYSEFEVFDNICFCLDTPPQESFLHMVFADLLITSKSSFSYKPALISNGIKVCPKDFWLGYPEKTDWVLADETGNFTKSKLIKNFE